MAVDNIAPRDDNHVTTLMGVDITTITGIRTPVVIGADAATHRLLVSAIITGGGSSGSQYAEGDTTAPGTGTLAIGRYKTVAPTLTDGQLYGLQLDSSGNLKVASTGGAAGTQYAELTTTTPATGTVALGRYNTSSPTLTNGQMYAPQLDVNGNLKVNIVGGSSSGQQYADGAARGTATGTLAMVDDGTNIQSIAGDTAGNQFVVLKTNGVASTANSTTVNLGVGAVFTGTSEDVSNYSAIQISVFSSHASATDGLSLQQSSDGTNWDLLDVYTIPATTGKVFSVQPSAKFFRLVYTNGATLTTSLRIQTVYHIIAPNPSSQRSADAYTNETDLTQNWTFNSLYNGTTWDRMRGDITNGLDVDVTRLPALVAGSAIVGKVGIDQTTPGTTNLVALTAETTKVIGVVRNADGAGNLLTSTTNALDINLKTSNITLPTAEVAPTTVLHGKTTVTTAGTRVVLAASTTVKSVTIKALAANSGIIYVGSSTVAAANGFELAAGDSISLDIANLNTVNIDSSTNGQGVSYLGVN